MVSFTFLLFLYQAQLHLSLRWAVYSLYLTVNTLPIVGYFVQLSSIFDQNAERFVITVR